MADNEAFQRLTSGAIIRGRKPPRSSRVLKFRCPDADVEGQVGLSWTLAKEGAAHNVRWHVVRPGFVRTPLVDKPFKHKEIKLQSAGRRHHERRLSASVSVVAAQFGAG